MTMTILIVAVIVAVIAFAGSGRSEPQTSAVDTALRRVDAQPQSARFDPLYDQLAFHVLPFRALQVSPAITFRYLATVRVTRFRFCISLSPPRPGE